MMDIVIQIFLVSYIVIDQHYLEHEIVALQRQIIDLILALDF